MSTLKPFLERRPQKPWSGLLIAGVIGALITALGTALVAGLVISGSLLAHAQPAKLLSACLGTFLAALVGGAIVGPALWWALPRYRLTPLRGMALFTLPLALAVLGALLGIPGQLKTHATYLLPLFAIQAAITAGFFGWWAYPAYASVKKKKRRPVAEQEQGRSETAPSGESVNPDRP